MMTERQERVVTQAAQMYRAEGTGATLVVATVAVMFLVLVGLMALGMAPRILEELFK